MSETIKGKPGQEDMGAFIDEAVEKRLLIYTKYQDLIYTKYQDLIFYPEELRRARAKGHFCRGPQNWEHREPKVEANKTEREALEAVAVARERAGQLREYARTGKEPGKDNA